MYAVFQSENNKEMARLKRKNKDGSETTMFFKNNRDFLSSGTTRNHTYFKHNEIGRNELCPCNSGKKHKKCCMNTDRASNEAPFYHNKEDEGNIVFDPEIHSPHVEKPFYLKKKKNKKR